MSDEIETRGSILICRAGLAYKYCKDIRNVLGSIAVVHVNPSDSRSTFNYVMAFKLITLQIRDHSFVKPRFQF